MNSFGLDELNTSRLMSILESHSCISKAVIFGSRARNTFKVTSDIDIAIWTDLNSESLSLSSNVISSLKADFEDSLIPYTVDLIDYQQLSNQRLKEEIDRYGKVFYLRGWVETSLGEVVETNKSSIDKGFGFNEILYLDTGSITENRIEQLQVFNIAEAPSRAKRLVKENDIVYSTVRPNQRHFGFIQNPQDNLVISTGFTVISAIQEKTDPKFLYYFLTQNQITNNLQQIAEHSTSTYPSIRPEHIENLKIFLPPLAEQKAIAAVLSGLDDKVELLREQNKTLEIIAQVLFKEWFVDFNFPDENGEPYKKSGGKMVESELGEIPEGWRVGKVGNIVDIFDSQRRPLSSHQRGEKQGKYPYHGATSVMDYIDEYLFDGIYLLLAEDGSVIDQNGYPVLQYVWNKFWVNNHAHILQ
ncbi:MAG: hypothetical protein EBR67_10530, partial [Proteobacteria bacterium]|nr:hypothetical protein [Pseudomonadota bacterium]